MMPGKKTNVLAIVTIALTVLVVLAGPLAKFGILPWVAALGLYALGSLVATVGGLICLVIVLRRRGGRLGVAATIAGLGAAAILAKIILGSSGIPRIHDITTDTANPPAFVSITPELRGPGANPIAYDSAITPEQIRAYPAVKPQVIPMPLPVVFDKTMKIIVARGWTVAGADSAVGRIEATDTSGWWGFEDDVVIRLAAEDAGTRVDIRSLSRVGKSDLGANADRIQKLQKDIAR